MDIARCAKPLALHLTLLVSCASAGSAQEVGAAQFEPDGFRGLEWRGVGPCRGGRPAAVVGLPDDRENYYMGAAGGGVWKTTYAGRSWDNVSDGFFGGSIGAVAVREWDPNVIYVGGGEQTLRGNVSPGEGV